jgi:hypothetical protein
MQFIVLAVLFLSIRRKTNEASHGFVAYASAMYMGSGSAAEHGNGYC